jgi:hypothetical protein
VIRGYTTAGKHGTVLTAMDEALLGCPWMRRSRPAESVNLNEAPVRVSY